MNKSRLMITSPILIIFQSQMACEGKYEVELRNDPAAASLSEETISEYVPGSQVVIKTPEGTVLRPVFTADPSAVCSHIEFYNLHGELVWGTADCSGFDSNLSSENIKAGVSIAGVTGNLEAMFPDCSEDIQTECVTTAEFPAVSIVGLESKLAVGEELAGVGGVYIGGGFAACENEGEIGCLVYADFRAAATAGLASKVLDGQTVAGIAGNISLPAETHVNAGTTYGIGGNSLTGSLTLPAASNVRQINGPYGLGGNSSIPLLANCTLDNGIACVTTADFPAIEKAMLSPADIRNGVTIAGVSGAYPSAAHRLIGSTATTDLSSLGPDTVPGDYEFFNSAGTRFEVTIADGGTIIAESNQQDFGEANTLYRSFNVAGDAALQASNIIADVSIFDVDGEAAIRPDDCIDDGDIDCVTVAAFPAVDLSLFAASDVRSGIEIGGIEGLLVPRPDDCTDDGDTDCVTVADFPAVDISEVLAGNIRNGVEILGVTGGYPSAEHRLVGSTATLDLSSLGPGTPIGDYEFFDSSGTRFEVMIAFEEAITAGTSPQVFGEAGTLYRSFSVAGDAALQDSNILTGVSIFDVHGNAAIRPADCVEDSEIDCVTVAAFPAVDLSLFAASDIRSGIEIGGVEGELIPSPEDCNTDDQTNCRTVSDFPAVEKALVIASNVRLGVEFGGIQGEVIPSPADCDDDLELGCVAVASFPAVDKDLLLAANIRAGVEIAGITGGYPSASHPLASHVDGSVDLTDFLTQLSTDDSFQFFDRTGARYTGSGSENLRAGHIRLGAEVLGLTGNLPENPSSFTVIAGNTQINLSWGAANGADGYLVLVSEDTPVSYHPENGTTYAVGPAGSDQVIFVGSATSFTHSGLADDTNYHYAIYSYSADNYYSNTAKIAMSQTTGGPDCSSLVSGQWVSVSGNADYGTKNFCVMKYEAKNVDDKPTSQPELVPWRSIAQADAKAGCEDLGPGYALMSNAEWMSTAIEIMNNPENWSGGSVGSGSLNRGNTNGSGPFAASADDNLGCVNISAIDDDCEGGWYINKRTMKLANGEIIWDMAGNAAHYLEDTNFFPSTNDKPHAQSDGGTIASSIDFVDVDTNFDIVAKHEMIPLMVMKSEWDSSHGIGQYLSGTNSDTLAVLRGGIWNDAATGGLFRLTLHAGLISHSARGFRCTYRGVDP